MFTGAVKQTWSRPNIKGSPPTPRDSHTCVTMGNGLFVFGGTDGSSPLADLHVLDTGSYPAKCKFFACNMAEQFS